MLDGLRSVAVMQWPGPIHEGSGKAFMIIDERADAAQREALLTIFSGGETEEGATVWNVFAATLDEQFEPAFEAIDIEIDVDEAALQEIEAADSAAGEPSGDRKNQAPQ